MKLLEMSIYGAVMILAAAVLRAIALKKLPKRLFVILWAIVLVRLLLPFPAALKLELPEAARRASSPVSAESTPESAAIDGSVIYESEAAPADAAPETARGEALPLDSAQKPAGKRLSRSETLALIWAAGAALTGGFFICALLRACLKFRKAESAEDEKTLAWMAAHPLRRRYAVKRLAGIDSPLTYGVLRPVILVPAGREPDPFALEHEYVHVRRFDALFKLLLALTAAVHWFNPAVWLMFVLANRDTELACDEAVLLRAGTEKRGDYARALLAAEERRSSGITALCAPFGANTTEERIREIMKFRKKTAFSVALAVLLALGLAACAATGAKTKAPKNVFEYDGLRLTVPEEYAELLIVETGPQILTEGDTSVVLNDTQLFRVTEKASREAGEKEHPGEDWGDGWLFSISRESEEALREMLSYGMDGSCIFAKDKDGNYYLRGTPTDVRFNREGDSVMQSSSGWKEWEELCDWSFNDLIPQFLKDNPQLESYSRTNTMADIYLARAAYGGEEIELRCLEYGTLDPGADRAPLEELLDGVSLVGVDNSLTPDGEYIVLYMPDSDARFDFFRAGGNYIRMTYYNGEFLYRAEYPDRKTETLDIMEAWCRSLAG